HSSSASIRQQVGASGNALGRGGPLAVTQGRVTGLDRTITARTDGGQSEQLSGLIQTDAPIKPGDSGGAVVNADAQVVGMITAAATQGPARRGSDIRSAIPANTDV